MKKYIPNILIVYICFVFIQSLFFKFSNSPETQHIFGTLNDWAISVGLPALFLPPLIPGIFNQYIIGAFELIASIFLLVGMFKKSPKLKVFGALIAAAIMVGAIFFHRFTPLGIEVQGDGGTLFIMACGVLIASLYTIYHNRVILCAKYKNNKEV